MAYSYLTGTANNNAFFMGNANFTADVDTTGVDLILVAMSSFHGSIAGIGIADNLSNTYTKIGSADGSDYNVTFFYCQAPTVGTVQKWTFTGGFGGGGAPSIVVACFSGSATSPLDQSVFGSSGGATTYQAGSITPSVHNELVIAVVASASSGPSIDSGFTVAQSEPNSGNGVGLAIAYLVQTTATAENPTWTVGSVGFDSIGSNASFLEGPGLINGAGHGIPSRQAFGTPGFIGNPGDQFIVGSAGIPSRQVFGIGALAGGNTLTGSLGIPSRQAFGTPGLLKLANQIEGSYGIPSRQSFGVGALTNKEVTLFISGVDVTKQMRINTLDIVNSTTQVSTASFTLGGQDLTSALLSYQVGQPVYIYHGSVRIFGGTIDSCYNSFYGVNSLEGPNTFAITCSDFSEILDRRYVAAVYNQNGSVFDLIAIVVDLVDTYLLQDGITYNASSGNNESLAGFGTVSFDWVTARQAFQQLADLVQWDFSVDYYGVLRFFPSDDGSGNAPFNIGDNDGNWLQSPPMTVQEYRTNYRNRQGVRSASQTTALYTDTFSAANPGPYPSSPQPPDGLRRFFVTLYEIPATPYVFVNGSAQNVVPIDQITMGPYDWYYIPNSFGVQQNPANAVLGPSVVLTVQYQSPIAPIIWVQCSDQIAIRAAIEGNSGVYEDVQDVQGITDPGELQAYAQGLLNRYGCLFGMPTEVIYTTDRIGLFAGMVQTIQVTNPRVTHGTYMLVQVETKDVDGKFLRTTVTADLGLFQMNPSAYYSALANQRQLAQPSNRNTYTWDLSPTVQGVSNPGLGSGSLAKVQAMLATTEVPLYFSITYNAGPSMLGPNVEMVINNGGFGNQLQLPISGGTYFVYFPTQSFPQGSSMVPFFQGGASGIKDGTLTLVTSVVRN